MNLKSKVSLFSGVAMIATLAIVFAVWWVNGRDQTWFFAVCALIVVTSFLPIFLKKKDKDQ